MTYWRLVHVKNLFDRRNVHIWKNTRLLEEENCNELQKIHRMEDEYFSSIFNLSIVSSNILYLSWRFVVSPESCVVNYVSYIYKQNLHTTCVIIRFVFSVSWKNSSWLSRFSIKHDHFWSIHESAWIKDEIIVKRKWEMSLVLIEKHSNFLFLKFVSFLFPLLDSESSCKKFFDFVNVS